MNQQQIVEGIITDVDLGYGLKYKDMDNIFLKLEIQQFDGTPCTQLFCKCVIRLSFFSNSSLIYIISLFISENAFSVYILYISEADKFFNLLHLQS